MPALTSGLSSSQGRDTGGRHSPWSRIAEPMPGISAIRWMRRLPAICELVAVGETLEKPPAQETGISEFAHGGWSRPDVQTSLPVGIFVQRISRSARYP